VTRGKISARGTACERSHEVGAATDQHERRPKRL
jgi:hypothetical protein